VGGKITAIEGAAESLPLTVYVDGKPVLTLTRQMVETLGLTVGMAFPPPGVALDVGPDEAATVDGEPGSLEGGSAEEAGEASGGGAELEEAKAAGLRLLAVRARSVAELSRRLSRKGYGADIVSAALSDLEDVGLLDDTAFAEQWAEERVRLRPVGPRRLRDELRAKGVPRSIVEATVERTYAEHPEVDLATKALLKRTRGRSIESSQTGRLQSFLLRRGFGYDAIARALERAGSGRDDAEADV